MGKIIQLSDYQSKDSIIDNETINCIKFLVCKLYEIKNKHGKEAAYELYSRLTYRDLQESKDIVDIYLDDSIQ